MKAKYVNIVRLLMLFASVLLLLTVIVPHHHHEDGIPCVSLEECHSHSCEANGHTIAFNSNSLQNQSVETPDPVLLLIPLYTLFDYINPPLPFPDDWAFDSERTLHAESLFSLWVVEAAGFRAPPQIV
jgi:hypothetical protein